MMARRISGSEGCGGGPLPSTFFPLPRSLQAPVLQVGEGDAGHQRVPVQACPGPALEVAEAEFLLQLLMCLLAGPARLDRGGQPPQRGPRREVAAGVLALAGVAPLADQPDLLAWQAGAVGVARAVGDAHPEGGEAGTERPLGAVPPGEAPPALPLQHRRGRAGWPARPGCLAGRPVGVSDGRSRTVA